MIMNGNLNSKISSDGGVQISSSRRRDHIDIAIDRECASAQAYAAVGVDLIERVAR